MPQKDKTGPNGEGPGTGRGLGGCEGVTPKNNLGKGLGQGRRGRCRRS
ncbi:DUF5320 family protein [Candidatus Woesearchaeota archaeon]|jgi:hypothetical protein|nr:DUF5320 family protein [archaeon]MBT6518213.1 DUF5320 family protein [Candidatus Woesearchaeota archaeon]MBT7368518.1 DUF5320 family protein [Candidatus Woesearchaeota archaeon]